MVNAATPEASHRSSQNPRMQPCRDILEHGIDDDQRHQKRRQRGGSPGVERIDRRHEIDVRLDAGILVCVEELADLGVAGLLIPSAQRTNAPDHVEAAEQEGEDDPERDLPTYEDTEIISRENGQDEDVSDDQMNP
ncbi:MAG: hypothetical protein WDN24_19370 [Sphingomonas sp.]